ncbi:unnamed protein product [Amoebophrya sp. A120]|nr:unnamed protein product [Amoebophrya sp. A120]|eukprot:GSA120T00005137001.1
MSCLDASTEDRGMSVQFGGSSASSSSHCGGSTSSSLRTSCSARSRMTTQSQIKTPGVASSSAKGPARIDQSMVRTRREKIRRGVREDRRAGARRAGSVISVSDTKNTSSSTASSRPYRRRIFAGCVAPLVASGALLNKKHAGSGASLCPAEEGICVIDPESSKVVFSAPKCGAFGVQSKYTIPTTGGSSVSSFAEVIPEPGHLLLEARTCDASHSSDASAGELVSAAAQGSGGTATSSELVADGLPVLSGCAFANLDKQLLYNNHHLTLQGCTPNNAAPKSHTAQSSTSLGALALLEKEHGEISRRKGENHYFAASHRPSAPMTISYLQTSKQNPADAPQQVVFKAQGCKMFITFVGGVTSAVENLGNSTVEVKNCARTGHQMDQYGILVSGINCEAIDLQTPEQANVRTEGNFTLTQCQKTSVLQGPDVDITANPAVAAAAAGAAGAAAAAGGGTPTPAAGGGGPALPTLKQEPVVMSNPGGVVAVPSRELPPREAPAGDHQEVARGTPVPTPSSGASSSAATTSSAVVPTAATSATQRTRTQGKEIAADELKKVVESAAEELMKAAPRKKESGSGTAVATSFLQEQMLASGTAAPSLGAPQPLGADVGLVGAALLQNLPQWDLTEIRRTLQEIRHDDAPPSATDRLTRKTPSTTTSYNPAREIKTAEASTGIPIRSAFNIASRQSDPGNGQKNKDVDPMAGAASQMHRPGAEPVAPSAVSSARSPSGAVVTSLLQEMALQLAAIDRTMDQRTQGEAASERTGAETKEVTFAVKIGNRDSAASGTGDNDRDETTAAAPTAASLAEKAREILAERRSQENGREDADAVEGRSRLDGASDDQGEEQADGSSSKTNQVPPPPGAPAAQPGAGTPTGTPGGLPPMPPLSVPLPMPPVAGLVGSTQQPPTQSGSQPAPAGAGGPGAPASGNSAPSPPNTNGNSKPNPDCDDKEQDPVPDFCKSAALVTNANDNAQTPPQTAPSGENCDAARTRYRKALAEAGTAIANAVCQNGKLFKTDAFKYRCNQSPCTQDDDAVCCDGETSNFMDFAVMDQTKGKLDFSSGKCGSITVTGGDVNLSVPNRPGTKVTAWDCQSTEHDPSSGGTAPDTLDITVRGCTKVESDPPGNDNNNLVESNDGKHTVNIMAKACQGTKIVSEQRENTANCKEGDNVNSVACSNMGRSLGSSCTCMWHGVAYPGTYQANVSGQTFDAAAAPPKPVLGISKDPLACVCAITGDFDPKPLPGDITPWTPTGMGYCTDAKSSRLSIVPFPRASDNILACQYLCQNDETCTGMDWREGSRVQTAMCALVLEKTAQGAATQADGNAASSVSCYVRPGQTVAAPLIPTSVTATTTDAGAAGAAAAASAGTSALLQLQGTAFGGQTPAGGTSSSYMKIGLGNRPCQSEQAGAEVTFIDKPAAKSRDDCFAECDKMGGSCVGFEWSIPTGIAVPSSLVATQCRLVSAPTRLATRSVEEPGSEFFKECFIKPKNPIESYNEVGSGACKSGSAPSEGGAALQASPMGSGLSYSNCAFLCQGEAQSGGGCQGFAYDFVQWTCTLYSGASALIAAGDAGISDLSYSKPFCYSSLVVVTASPAAAAATAAAQQLATTQAPTGAAVASGALAPTGAAGAAAPGQPPVAAVPPAAVAGVPPAAAPPTPASPAGAAASSVPPATPPGTVPPAATAPASAIKALQDAGIIPPGLDAQGIADILAKVSNGAIASGAAPPGGVPAQPGNSSQSTVAPPGGVPGGVLPSQNATITGTATTTGPALQGSSGASASTSAPPGAAGGAATTVAPGGTAPPGSSSNTTAGSSTGVAPAANASAAGAVVPATSAAAANATSTTTGAGAAAGAGNTSATTAGGNANVTATTAAPPAGGAVSGTSNATVDANSTSPSSKSAALLVRESREEDGEFLSTPSGQQADRIYEEEGKDEQNLPADEEFEGPSSSNRAFLSDVAEDGSELPPPEEDQERPPALGDSVMLSEQGAESEDVPSADFQDHQWFGSDDGVGDSLGEFPDIPASAAFIQQRTTARSAAEVEQQRPPRGRGFRDVDDNEWAYADAEAQREKDQALEAADAPPTLSSIFAKSEQVNLQERAQLLRDMPSDEA